MDIRLALSCVVPVPMRSTYEVIDAEVVQKNASGQICNRDVDSHVESARWWQWRGMIFGHVIEALT